MTATLERPTPSGRRTPRHAAARTPAVPAPHRFRPDIGGLRAVAVLLVVLYHCRVPGLSAGYVGVDVFFVISGFLITGQLVREVQATGRVNLPRFYARRMRRLLPAALLVIVATAVVARFWGPLLQVRATATDSIWAALYAINFHLAAEGVDYQQATGPQSPLQHFWSLAVEEQFYLIWPVLIIVGTIWFARRRPGGVRPVLTLVALGAGAVSLYLSVTVTSQSAPEAYFSVQTRAWEFGAGALVALAAPLLARTWRPVAVLGSWAGLAVVVVTAFVYDDATPFPGTAAIVPVAATAVLIACGCRDDGTDRAGATRLLSLRPAQWIGKVSYGWYLWHWPVLILAPAVLDEQLSWVRGVELSVLALWLAALTHFVVELPTQRPRLRTGRWLTVGVALSLVVAAVGVTVQRHGPDVGGDGRYAASVDLRYPNADALSTALQQSTQTTDVPANLTPGLTEATKDVPVTQSGCHLNYLQTAQKLCAFGDLAATRTAVLFGDSHAQQWDGAFIAAARRSHWRLLSWTKAACPLADIPFENPALKRDYTECTTWRQQTIDRILTLKPALVIASQSDLITGSTFSNGRWAQATARTLGRLTAGGVRVTYLADTPTPIGDTPSCVAQHLQNTTPCMPRSDEPYGGGSAFYAQRHQDVSQAARRAGATVTDPVRWLCGITRCPVIVGNALVYRDDSHLTNTYSTLLAPIVRPVLLESQK